MKYKDTYLEYGTTDENGNFNTKLKIPVSKDEKFIPVTGGGWGGIDNIKLNGKAHIEKRIKLAKMRLDFREEDEKRSGTNMPREEYKRLIENIRYYENKLTQGEIFWHEVQQEIDNKDTKKASSRGGKHSKTNRDTLVYKIFLDYSIKRPLGKNIIKELRQKVNK